MGDLTKNISRHEVACKCGCGFDTADIETILAVQICADHFAQKLRKARVVLNVHSGCRCEAHNEAEGGSRNSQHLYSRAIDFSIGGVDPSDVYDYLCVRYPDQFGIGKYNTFTHLDTKSGGARRW